MKSISGWLMAGAAALALAACGEKPVEPTPELSPETAQVPMIATDPTQGDGGVSAFYDPAAPAPEKPGTMIRTEAQPAESSLAEAGQAMRILYSSTDGLGGKTPVAVSGSLFLPKGEAPAGGWPLMAWAHGTVGVADVCAPSWTARSERDTIYLNHWLKQGYAVVASDYQGLGTPGGHPYLATKPAAFSVLDSIRAVQADANLKIGKPVVLVGQSQGGGAAFATAGAAETYAPELDIRGTVATGTPYFTTTTAPAERDPTKVEGVFAYTLYILYLVKQADPSFDTDTLFTEAAKPTMDLARTACLTEVWESIEATKLSQATAFTRDPTPEVSKYFGLMAYDTLKIKGPVFMGTGGKDHDVPPEGQERLFKDACAAGSVIERHVYAKLDHSGTVNGSLVDSTPFVKKAFAGEAIAGNCPKAG
ncbi:MAG: alpha/beta fold hydrolase [Hyphomonadaceae bacterium]|nr:alpha/beta fold hydrolase [Hyphomonadaceae bacterium]